MPPLDEARGLVGGMFKDLAKTLTTEDSKKIRELVRDGAIRPDRKLNARELEQVAAAAEQIRDAIAPLAKQLDDVVKITSFTTDIDEFFRHAATRNRYFGKAMPASTAVEVRRLAHPDWMIEIEATAIV